MVELGAEVARVRVGGHFARIVARAENSLDESIEISTHSLLTAAAAAGVGHHVMLSVVGTERLLRSGYLRAFCRRDRSHANRLRNASVFSATSRQPASIVNECPRPGILTISVTPLLRFSFL